MYYTCPRLSRLPSMGSSRFIFLTSPHIYMTESVGIISCPQRLW